MLDTKGPEIRTGFFEESYKGKFSLNYDPQLSGESSSSSYDPQLSGESSSSSYDPQLSGESSSSSGSGRRNEVIGIGGTVMPFRRICLIAASVARS
jgi:hypothetical protein